MARVHVRRFDADLGREGSGRPTEHFRLTISGRPLRFDFHHSVLAESSDPQVSPTEGRSWGKRYRLGIVSCELAISHEPTRTRVDLFTLLLQLLQFYEGRNVFNEILGACFAGAAKKSEGIGAFDAQSAIISHVEAIFTPLVAVTTGRAQGVFRRDSDQRCEYSFYVGEYRALRVERPDALALFRSASETCPKDFVEYVPSLIELKELEKKSK